MPSPANRDCAILFTHFWSPALKRHVDRLKAEASGVVDIFVVLHAEPGTPVPAGMMPDFTVALADIRKRMEFRAAIVERSGLGQSWGYVELLWFAAFLHERLAGYQRFWFIEYDVDLRGDWGRFFTAAAKYEGDLLLTRVHRLSQEPGWFHAPGLEMPPVVTDPLIGLFCISRLTRDLVEAYADTVARPGWDGHFEALIPSFADSAGFHVAEISGEGAWTPPERTNLHYNGRFDARATAHTTFSFRPPHAYRYFSDRRFAIGDRDTLYHPVKTALPLRQRLRFMEQDWRWGLRPPPQ